MVLGDWDIPIKRPKDDEGSDDSYIFRMLIDACVFAKEQKKHNDGVTVVEIVVLEHQGSGM